MKNMLLLLIAVVLFTAGATAQDQTLVSLSELYDVIPNVANCNEGKLKDSEKQNVLSIYNQIRIIHGLKPLQYNSNYDIDVAKSALINVANALLDHFPKTSYECYSQEGYNGSSTSNLYIYAAFGPNSIPESRKSIEDWIIDKNIDDLGHRRNMLNPFLKYASFGRVDGYSKKNPDYYLTGMSLKVHQFPDFHNLSDWNQDFVAYPYHEYPSSFFDENWYLSFSVVADKSNIWNNSQALIDLSQATVTITGPNNNKLTISNLKYDYASYGIPNCLYWKASGIAKEVTYNVTISNVKVQGTPKTYSYWFKITDQPINPSLQPPTLLSPANQATDVELPVTLSWSNVPNASYYLLQVDNNNNFTSPEINLNNLTTSRYIIISLSPNTTYYWRVAVVVNSQQSEWSSVYSFTTEDLPLLAPALVQPINNATNISTQPKFIWLSVEGATKYHCQVAMSTSFDEFSMFYEKNDLTDTVLSTTPIFPYKTQFFWRVRSFRNAQYSVWSDVWTFWTLDPTSVEDDIITVIASPFAILGTQDAEIKLSKPSFIRAVRIVDLLGNPIWYKEFNEMLNSISIPINSLSDGTYFVEIEFPNKSILLQAILLK
jgi:uncharacterized protein YkwD